MCTLRYDNFEVGGVLIRECMHAYGGECAVQEADPLDCCISSSCSASNIQESASKVEGEFFLFDKISDSEFLDDVNILGVHCTSGIIPTWSMSCKAGDKYFATVMNRADPSCSSVTLWTRREGGSNNNSLEVMLSLITKTLLTPGVEEKTCMQCTWIFPFPKVLWPTRVARPLSCKAPANISLALALPSFTCVESTNNKIQRS